MSEYLKLTRKRIEKIFDECNSQYFVGKVDKPDKFELWTPNKKCVGWVRAVFPYKGKSKETNLINPQTYFHISNRYNWTEENLKKVVIHEMIHLYIKDYLKPLTFWQKKFPFLIKQHDKKFRKTMQGLNQKYGLEITVKAPFLKKELKK